MTPNSRSLPIADDRTGLEVLKALIRQPSLLVALEELHRRVGDTFQITLPGFSPAVLVGPETNRQILVSERRNFLWRTETDPVTCLLRQGVLVVDGQQHDDLRAHMDPMLQRRQITPHIDSMWHDTNRILATWANNSVVDMLIEMRRVALLILVGSLFKIDFWPDLDRLFQPILRMLKYISPGLWLMWPKIPRFGYRRAIRQIDDYLYGIIARRRADVGTTDDLLGHLIATTSFDDDLIRDQLLTMFIAGHDTSAALLSWTLYLLGSHPQAIAQAQAEVDAVLDDGPPSINQLSQLHYLDQVIKETLRLYPPIHLGNRQAATDMDLHRYCIPAQTRVMYSIYLSHRHSAYWDEPARFKPERFARNAPTEHPPFTYLPFGGGPRNCIGATFAQIEAKVVLARILQTVNLELVSHKVRPYMGATLEPHPGVLMRIKRRRPADE